MLMFGGAAGFTLAQSRQTPGLGEHGFHNRISCFLSFRVRSVLRQRSDCEVIASNKSSQVNCFSSHLNYEGKTSSSNTANNSGHQTLKGGA
jgi:hypothetical protein